MLSHLSLAVRGVCGSAESLRDLVHWEVFGGGFWQVAGRIGRGLIVAGSLPGDASGILRTQQGGWQVCSLLMLMCWLNLLQKW